MLIGMITRIKGEGVPVNDIQIQLSQNILKTATYKGESEGCEWVDL